MKAGFFSPNNLEVVGESIENVTRKFKRPPTNLEFGKDITVISDGACSACRGTIHSVVYDLEQMKRMGEIRNLFIVVGANAKVPENLGNIPIVMGTCLKSQEEKGCYVVGCPPNNDQMLAAIKKVCKIS
jgi:Ni,Fe-hydrogenase III small subunit